MRSTVAALITGVGLLAAGAASAHHSFPTEFDVKQPLTLKGTLVKWEMINPHSWFHVEVKGPDGRAVVWMVEGGSPNQLIRLGVTKNSVAVGTTLVIDGYRARDGSNKAVGRNITLSDGKRLFMGGSAPGQPAVQ